MMYDDDLILFPSADESRPDMGVKHHQVEGNYKSGRNAKEAAAMVEAILSFMQSEPLKSLGVVTVNKQQTNYPKWTLR